MDRETPIVGTDEVKRASVETRRLQIIEAAIRCFQSKGYENTTIDDIAAEYGLSKGSIYWCFSSKRDILIAVFEHMISQLFRVYESLILNEAVSAKQRIISIFHLVIDVLLKNHEAYRPFIVLVGAAYEDDGLRQMIAKLYKQGSQQMVEILRQGEIAGEFVVPNKNLTSTLMIAAAEGLFTRQILMNDIDVDELKREADYVVECFLPAT